ncbi:hypothetical protein CEXT_267241 [Caerostris extrusa]|uniref:Uncharacterized protein n=1 Tax=Caerostris extrusa TaxID=172846 RepID=A0AAV4YA87_CAEEX|nr:hypothetical protein CEXT_267241 [Caerostris extrusa]
MSLEQKNSLQFPVEPPFLVPVVVLECVTRCQDASFLWSGNSYFAPPTPLVSGGTKIFQAEPDVRDKLKKGAFIPPFNNFLFCECGRRVNSDQNGANLLYVVQNTISQKHMKSAFEKSEKVFPPSNQPKKRRFCAILGRNSTFTCHIRKKE